MRSKPWVLVTWRGKDPSPPPPFAEAYFCGPCGDYFSLAFEPGSQARGPGVRVLATPPGKPSPTAIFCPQCGAGYPQYGAVAVEPAPARPQVVAELLVTSFPPGVPRAREVKVGGLRVERFVLLITAPRPPADVLEGFVVDVAGRMIGSLLRAPVVGGAVPLHALEVTGLCDDTAWLNALLDPYLRDGAGTRVFGSLGPIEAQSGARMLLCAVAPLRSTR